jgi:hypothetical protein
MKTSVNILDQVLLIIQQQVEKDANLNSAEPLIVNSTEDVKVPYRAFSIIIGDFQKAILGIASPEYGEMLSLMKAKFVLFAQTASQTIARMPMQPVECSRTVNDYKKYLRDMRRQLREAYFRCTLDQIQTERLVGEAWRVLALPLLEE